MTIKTGRAEGTADVRIDYEKCTVCGLCVEVCKGAPLVMQNGKVIVDQPRFFGCIGCGQCMAVCPRDCIAVEGRELSSDDILEMPAGASRASYDQLKALMLGRRSIRNFKDREVGRDSIDMIIDAASTAPMGIPPSDVEILVLHGREKVREFARDMVELMRRSRWMLSPAMCFLMRPFIGREAYESMKTFVLPVINIIVKEHEKGSDYLLYDAPLAMYFHTSPYSDPVDPIIPATYAMLAAESLGLGSCMIGTIAPFLKYSRKLREKYGIPPKNRQGIMVIFGYQAIKFHKAVRRSFAGVYFFKCPE